MHSARLLGISLLVLAAAPARAGGEAASCARNPTGAWTRVVAGAVVDYGTGYESYRENDGRPYEVTVDPWRRCRAYRIDGNAIRVTDDGGATWQTFDERPAPFGPTHVYAVAPGVVYVSEDGDGTAVLRYDAACPRGCAANGGVGALQGKHVAQVAFAPSDPEAAYAMTLRCKETGELPTGCTKTSPFVGPFLGKVGYWRTSDGGATWLPIPIPDPDTPRDAFVIRVDPTDAANPVVYDRPDGVVTPGQQARLLVGRDANSVSTSVQAKDGSFRVLRHRGILYAIALDVVTGRRVVWDSTTRQWHQVGNEHAVEQTAVVPLGERLFALQVAREGGTGEGHDARAVWSDDVWSSLQVEAGRFPSWLPPETAYVLGDVQAGPDGTAYVSVARRCFSNGTYEGAVRRCGSGEWEYEWTTWAYRPPALGIRIATGADPDAGLPSSCALPSCAVTAIRSCPTPSADGAGAGLAYDGTDLLYTVASAAARTVTIGRVALAACDEKPPLTFALDAGDLAAAVGLTKRTHRPGVGTPTLDATAVVADTLAYDTTGDRLFFSLRDTTGGETTQGNPASVWVWPGAGEARLVYVGDRCLRNAGGRSGMDLLAWDGTGLVACADARPLPVSGTPYCVLNGPYRGYGYGWLVTSWTPVKDRALLLVDSGTSAQLVTFDAQTCTGETSWGAGPLAAAKAPGEHTQLACTAPAGHERRTLIWQRKGETATAYALPGSGVQCPQPAALPLLRPVPKQVVAKRQPPPPQVPEPLPPPAPQPPVVPRPPAPALAVAPPLPPAPAPGANVGALGEEKQQQQQLAYASENIHHSDDEDDAEELAMVALVTASAFAVAWRRRAAAAVERVRR